MRHDQRCGSDWSAPVVKATAGGIRVPGAPGDTAANRVEDLRRRARLDAAQDEVGNEIVRVDVDVVDEQRLVRLARPRQHRPRADVARVVAAQQRPVAPEAAVIESPFPVQGYRVQILEWKGQVDPGLALE